MEAEKTAEQQRQRARARAGIGRPFQVGLGPSGRCLGRRVLSDITRLSTIVFFTNGNRQSRSTFSRHVPLRGLRKLFVLSVTSGKPG